MRLEALRYKCTSCGTHVIHQLSCCNMCGYGLCPGCLDNHSNKRCGELAAARWFDGVRKYLAGSPKKPEAK